jgi:predicted Zn-ribbon and HTH transcriptional regulator
MKPFNKQVVKRMLDMTVPKCEDCGGKLNSYNATLIEYSYCPKCMNKAYMLDGDVVEMRDP